MNPQRTARDAPTEALNQERSCRLKAATDKTREAQQEQERVREIADRSASFPIRKRRPPPA